MDKPDILVFMSDQHNADYLGCMDHSLVETPNMDKLARQGVLLMAALDLLEAYDYFNIFSPAKKVLPGYQKESYIN